VKGNGTAAMNMTAIARACGVAGLLLLAVNLAGLVVPLRAPHIQGLFKDDLTLSYEQVLAGKDRRPSESPQAYLERATMLVNRGMAHIWDDAVADAYRLRVPVQENFILYLWSFIEPERYGKYEFADAGRALERGVGLCSQQAMALTDILNENGVRADIAGLEGHVVVRAEAAPGRWMIADPDYGVVIPHDLAVLEQNAALVRQYYRDADARYVVDQPARVYGIPFASFADYLADIYGPAGNRIFPGGTEGYVPVAVENFERRAYQLKWLIPALLLAPAVFVEIRRRLRLPSAAVGLPGARATVPQGGRLV
jgi:hypothetical protein